jgi:hypothetical protein
MLRTRAILALATLLSLALLRPLHWGVHALGGHAGCEPAAEHATECCDHDHGGPVALEHDADGPGDRVPADRDDLADCELCLAIGLLASELPTEPASIVHDVATGHPRPADAIDAATPGLHGPLLARPPPAITT